MVAEEATGAAVREADGEGIGAAAETADGWRPDVIVWRLSRIYGHGFIDRNDAIMSHKTAWRFDLCGEKMIAFN